MDLIFICCHDFEDILRPTLMKEWNALQEALVHFNYFKCWDEKTIRECCILSRLKEFQADEVQNGKLSCLVHEARTFFYSMKKLII